MRSPLDISTLVLAGVAVVLAGVAYLNDPALPMVVALLLAGLMQAGVVTPGGPVFNHE